VRVFSAVGSWLEDEALRQLYAVAKLEGMRLVAGFPDLHPGKGTPVGAAFVTEGVLYPHLIGGDIGCGMALFELDLVRGEVKLDRWAQLPFELEHPWSSDISRVLAEWELESTEFDNALGTLGAGNHFAELQAVEEVVNAREFRKFGLGKEQLVMLVHSGSRGLGEAVLRDYVSEHQTSGLDAESFAVAAYLQGHDMAVRWARVNRQLLAERFAQVLGAEAGLLWDGCHNSISARDHGGGTVWIHRKGAVADDSQALVIPGSRGSLSYLVKPEGDGASHAWSLAHGAGRKWARSEARLRMRERFEKEQLIQTSLGGRVLCGDRDLLFEEAPEAYKNIDAVIQALVETGLVSVIATFRPLLTYKMRQAKC